MAITCGPRSGPQVHRLVERSRFAGSSLSASGWRSHGQHNGQPMTPLQVKYIRDLAIRGRAERTQQSCTSYVLAAGIPL